MTETDLEFWVGALCGALIVIALGGAAFTLWRLWALSRELQANHEAQEATVARLRRVK